MSHLLQREELGSCSGSHVYMLTRLPVRPGSMVQGGGATRTGELAGSHIAPGGAGDIIIWYHRGAHWLQCPVGGVLPVHAKGEGGDAVIVETSLFLKSESGTGEELPVGCETPERLEVN